MKKHNSKTVTHIFSFLLLFLCMTLLITGFAQGRLLSYIYSRSQRKNLDQATASIVAAINNSPSDLQRVCYDISDYYNINILVTDRNGSPIARSDGSPNGLLRKMSNTDLYDLYQQASQNGGSITISSNVESPDTPAGPFNNPEMSNGPRSTFGNLIKVSILSADSGADTTIIYTNAVLTPLSQVTDANRAALVVTTLILVALAGLLSYLFARRISTPIVQLNQEATKMMNGENDIHFPTSTGFSELDELSEKLNTASQELTKASHLQQELLANVSHDLRTPLTLITGYAEMMRDLPDENNEENLNLIISETKRITNLVNDVLDLSKYNAGSIPLQRENFNITTEIQNTIRFMYNLMDKAAFQIDFYPQSELYTYADKLAISRVLTNLISNAINYSGESKRVEVRQLETIEGVRIDIIDYGNGIAPEELPNVFDRYYRSKESHTRGIVGTGLGLSIVKSILEQHDAKFGVFSAPGKGSDFWFVLPKAQ